MGNLVKFTPAISQHLNENEVSLNGRDITIGAELLSKCKELNEARYVDLYYDLGNRVIFLKPTNSGLKLRNISKTTKHIICKGVLSGEFKLKKRRRVPAKWDSELGMLKVEVG